MGQPDEPERVFERRMPARWNLGCLVTSLLGLLALGAPVALIQLLPRVLGSADLRERLLWSSASAAAALVLMGGVLAGPLWSAAARRRFARARLRGDLLRFELPHCAQPLEVPREAVAEVTVTEHGLLVACGRGWWNEWAFPLLLPVDCPAERAALCAELEPMPEPTPGAPEPEKAPTWRGQVSRARRVGGVVELVVMSAVVAGLLWLLYGIAAAFPPGTSQEQVWTKGALVALGLCGGLLLLFFARRAQANFLSCEVGDAQVRFRGPGRRPRPECPGGGDEVLPMAAITGHRLVLGEGLWLTVPSRGWRDRWLPRLVPAESAQVAREALRALHAGGARCCPRASLVMGPEADAPPGARTRFPALKGRTPTA